MYVQCIWGKSADPMSLQGVNVTVWILCTADTVILDRPWPEELFSHPSMGRRMQQTWQQNVLDAGRLSNVSLRLAGHPRPFHCYPREGPGACLVLQLKHIFIAHCCALSLPPSCIEHMPGSMGPLGLGVLGLLYQLLHSRKKKFHPKFLL